MKTPFKLSTLALAAALLSGAQVQAASIADTGTPSGNSFPLELGGASWLAGQIDVSTATSIQSIQAYLNDMGAGGSFTVALYGDSATHLPGNMLGSWAANFATPAGADGWNGVSGLDFAVQAGKYWVALEVQGSDTFSGVAPVGAPLPLAKYAFNDGGFAGYQAMPNAFGVQVTAVPEPQALAMMLAGLALIAGIAKRRARNS